MGWRRDETFKETCADWSATWRTVDIMQLPPLSQGRTCRPDRSQRFVEGKCCQSVCPPGSVILDELVALLPPGEVLRSPGEVGLSLKEDIDGKWQDELLVCCRRSCNSERGVSVLSPFEENSVVSTGMRSMRTAGRPASGARKRTRCWIVSGCQAVSRVSRPILVSVSTLFIPAFH
jgi:hypothetical protein